ncbi:hypothetical protein ROZALSC1DRAFT_27819 [Rozella allomycis CSF55]|uniref:G-patch domain-containing protein n=1 Tax=Rozella allomycis (strain CSF55) TaxID=988480 RepID=A0A4P9YMG9_ROZAC|nr:hypothetical protein ROZALSC1DRAFT_27819 [Rozella allomycis CSF55]
MNTTIKFNQKGSKKIEKHSLFTEEETEHKDISSLKPSTPVKAIPFISKNEWKFEEHETFKLEQLFEQVTETEEKKDERFGLIERKREIVDEDVPLLMKNKVPGLKDGWNEDEKFKHDVSLRPDERHTDYENVPIEEFGAALLRGMGWDKGKAIGRNPERGLVEPIEFIQRPHKFLGLGANPDAIAVPVPQKKYIKPGESREKKEYVLPGDSKKYYKSIHEKLVEKPTLQKVGARVTVIEGVHEGLHGIVSQIYVDSVLVTLENNQEDVRLKFEKLKLYDGKTVEISKSNQRRDLDDNWIVPFLKVRIVSRSFENGKYFNLKGIIQDVTAPQVCIIKLDNGKTCHDVKQRHLETIIPEIGGLVYIVRGKLKGNVGRLLAKNKKLSNAAVKIHGMESIMDFDYDDISEYHGHVDDE